MNLESTALIKSVKVFDASGWPADEVEMRVASLTKKKKEGELYLITTLPIESSLETYPEGQVLNIVIDKMPKIPKDDVESFLTALGQLRDYYPDLTVKVIDNTDKISRKGLPKDTIVKKK